MLFLRVLIVEVVVRLWSVLSLKGNSSARLQASLVFNIEDLLLSLQATIGNLKLRLVERLWLVEAITVRSPELVSVLIFLSLPGCSIPELTIALVATLHGVGAPMHLQLLGVAEVGSVVTGAPVGLVMDLGVMEAVTSGSHPVVLGLVVRCSVEHSASTIPATTDLHCFVVLWNKLSVESCGGEAVVSLIDDVFSENFTGLFCDTLSKELVVDLYAWDVTLVAWNN